MNNPAVVSYAVPFLILCICLSSTAEGQRPTSRRPAPAAPAAAASSADASSEPAVAATPPSGACSNASIEPGETRGEPTERDICTALESSFRNADASLQQMQKSSCSSSGRSDPMAAMLCLSSSMVASAGLPQISVSKLEKVACVSAAASGKPGFYCDYIAQVTSANGNISALTSAAGATVTTRRFVKRGQGWLMMPSESAK